MQASVFWEIERGFGRRADNGTDLYGSLNEIHEFPEISLDIS